MKSETLLKKVKANLLKYNNSADVQKMIENHFEYASRKYTTVKNICNYLLIKYKSMKTISQERAEKLARNINAMDTNYQYASKISSIKFWSNLKDKLNAKLANLSDEDKRILIPLCNETEAKFFNLI